MVNVLTTPFRLEVLTFISGVVYSRVLHLGEQLPSKSKWNHYNLVRPMDYMEQSSCNSDNLLAHRKAITVTFKHIPNI